MSAASWVGAAALVLATIAGTWFMIAYSLRGKWWRPSADDPHGEHRAHLGYFTLNLTVIFWVYDFRLLFDPTVFAWVRAVLFALVAFNMAWRLALLIRRGNPRRRPVGDVH